MNFFKYTLMLLSFCISSAYAQNEMNPFATDTVQASSTYSKPYNTERALLVANIAATTAAGIGVLKLNANQDKTRHFLAGYVAGNVTNGAFQLLLPEDTKNKRLLSALLGIGASILAGVGKEVWDSMGHHGTPDVKDALATGAGGIAGSITISFDLEKAFL